MNTTRWIVAGALFNAAFGLFHLGFWKLFRWREELPRLGLVNRGVVPVLNVMLCYVFFAAAAAQVAQPEAWIATPLGRCGTGAVAGFWLLRASLQPFFWPRTRGSWAFCAVFLLGASMHALALASPAHS
jgi:hypothetical protein